MDGSPCAKGFPAVMTDNTDMYYGCHIIVTNPPADNNVHVVVFTTGDNYDERADAQDHIESYVTIANQLALRPMNDQLKGQRSVTCFAGTGVDLPEVGETLVFVNTVTGDLQYVRISSLAQETQTFYDVSNNSYEMNIITLGLSAALCSTIFPVSRSLDRMDSQIPRSTQLLLPMHRNITGSAR